MCAAPATSQSALPSDRGQRRAPVVALPAGAAARSIPPFESEFLRRFPSSRMETFARCSNQIIAEIEASLNSEAPQETLGRVRSAVIQEYVTAVVHHHRALRPLEIRAEAAYGGFFGSFRRRAADIIRAIPFPGRAFESMLYEDWMRASTKESTPASVPSVRMDYPGPDLPVYPLVYVRNPDALFRGLSSAEGALFREQYNPPEYNFLCRLKDLDSLLCDQAKAANLWDVLKKASGIASGPLPELFRKTRAGLPLALGPLEAKRTELGVVLVGDYSAFRVPYGSFPHTRGFLEHVQSEIAAGKRRGCSIVVTGRVDAEFLKWAYGCEPEDLGPIPDIEICYRLVLPSGAPYHFILKEARNFSARPPNNVEPWSDEDRRVVTAIAKYFENPSERRSLELLTNLKHDAFPVDSDGWGADPLEIDSFLEYQRFILGFTRSIHSQVLEAADGSRITYRKDPWLEPSYADPAFFEKRIRERLERMPREQSFFPEDEIRIAPEEVDRFMRHYAGKLFAICNEERARCQREAEDPKRHSERRALGYDGPPEGFPLPLDYMLMDMIIDMRRFDQYRAGQAQKQTRFSGQQHTPEQIKVPVRMGRSYEHPEWFLDAKDIPEVLAKLPPRREIVATLEDPQSPTGMIEVPFNELHHIPEKIQLINLERLKSILEVQVGSATNRRQRSMLVRFGRFVHSAEERISALSAAVDAVKKEREEGLQELARSLKGSKDRGARMGEARAAADEKVRGAQRELRRAREALIEKYAELMPPLAQAACLRLRSIVDRETATFIYSIGPDGVPRYSCERIDFKRTHPEAIGARNMYGGGQQHFMRHDEIFQTYEAWEEFDRTHRARRAPLAWVPTVLDDSSGHYEPGPSTLVYSGNVCRPLLVAAGFDLKHFRIGDALASKTRMRGMAYDFGHTKVPPN